jgi:hypothetical protein
MSPRNYQNFKGEKMPVKLKSFTTAEYYRACGFSTKNFKAGVKGLALEYHHHTGIMLTRDGHSPEFVPIHNVLTITPENIEDLQEVLGVAPKKEAQVIAVVEDGPITDAPPKRKRRTKAEMEAVRAAVI